MDDPALQALFLPFLDDVLAPPKRAALLHARSGQGLQQFRSRFGAVDLVAEQSFRPFADALPPGLALVDAIPAGCDAVLVLPPRQRTAARAALVDAVDGVAAGGVVVASVANNAGARSIEADFTELVGTPASLSKHKCRVFWRRIDADTVDAALAQRWRDDAAPQTIADGRFLSRPGLFAWDRVDPASALLAAQLPADLAGHGADLGAGYGYLAAELIDRCPGVVALDLYEAQARALELARRNLAALPAVRSGAVALRGFWHDVTCGLPHRYDFIVTNPPFHQGRADEPELGRAFIRAAAKALQPQGRLLLVANRHLPYESVLRECFAHGDVLADLQGFKVIAAREPRA